MTTSAELAEATADQIASARAALSAYLQTLYPTLSIVAGPLADLVLGPASDALAAVEAVATRRAASLDPEVALATGGYDETLLDAALTGRGVTRGQAATASGTAILVFSTDAAVSVPGTYRLTTADGVVFKPTSAVGIKPTTSTQVLSSDFKLVAFPEGGYGAVVPITAVSTGADANRPSGVALTYSTTLANQTAAYIGTATTGGADIETDAQLLARLPAAASPRTVGSVAGIEAIIRDAFPTTSAVAVQGYGHAGMRRARSVVGLQSPGKADARTRTASAPSRVVVRVTATYQGVVGPYGSWRFSVAAASIPGWFNVEKVIRAGAKVTTVGYTPTAITRGFDISGVTNPPDVRVATDAAFSAYATCSVTFSDPDTSTSGLTVGVSTKTYDAVFRTIPGVDTAQTAILGETVRAVGGDCLVRAATPVLVVVAAAAIKPSGVTLTAAEVSASVAHAVNATGIDPILNGAAVAAAAIAYLPIGTGLTLSGWTGTVYSETGNVSISGIQGLSVTTDWTAGLGTDAVAYYADPESIIATVT